MKKSRVRRSTKPREFPIPSFLPGVRGSADWHVRAIEEGETPHTINLHGGTAEMALPVGDDTRTKFIRIHEMLHAAHSPMESPRPIMRGDTTFINTNAMMIAEEYRINLYGRYLVGGGHNTGIQDEEFEQRVVDTVANYYESKDPRYIMDLIDFNFVSWPLSSSPLGVTSPVERILWNLRDTDRFDRPTMSELIEVMSLINRTVINILWLDEHENLWTDGTIPSWDAVIRLADYLSQTHDQLTGTGTAAGNGAGNQDAPPDLQGEQDKDIKRVLSRHGMASEEKPTPLTKVQRATKLAEDQANFNEGAQHDDTPVWGKMSMRVAKMIYRLPKNKKQRSKYRATDEGAIPRFTHRHLVDGKVFARKKRVNGGSVLIDDSGSMAWHPDDLKKIVEAAPAVNIAAYSARTLDGELVIIARDGRYADMENYENRPSGGGNMVDLPALEWLASQSKPRIWVSDTRVFPVSGDANQALFDCIRICRDYDINIVFEAKEAHAIFEGRREIYR